MSQKSNGAWYASTPRRMFAVILSALMPGVGQVMLGRRGWAVFWVVLPLVFMLFVPVFGLAAVVAQYLTRLGASVHAALMRTGGQAPDPTSKTVVLAALLTLGYFAVFTGVGHDIYENTTMHDGAMYPALEAGDFGVIDKTAYGLRLPFVGKLSTKPVHVGDVVAVDDPDKPDQLLITRVVAVGPTSFDMKDGALIFAGAAAVGRRQLSGECAYAEPDKENLGIVDVPCVRFEEQAGGRTWQSVQPREGGASTQQQRQIAAGQVVVALDNRRGPAPWKIVPVDAVRGRVTSVWFSMKGPRGIAWDRINLPVR